MASQQCKKRFLSGFSQPFNFHIFTFLANVLKRVRSESNQIIKYQLKMMFCLFIKRIGKDTKQFQMVAAAAIRWWKGSRAWSREKTHTRTHITESQCTKINRLRLQRQLRRRRQMFQLNGCECSDAVDLCLEAPHQSWMNFQNGSSIWSWSPIWLDNFQRTHANRESERVRAKESCESVASCKRRHKAASFYGEIKTNNHHEMCVDVCCHSQLKRHGKVGGRIECRTTKKKFS